MGKKLYLGNLAISLSENSLRDLFGQYGNVESANVIMDRDSGRSKGFGFVEMSSDDEALAAIDDQLTVADLKAEEGVTILTDPAQTVVKIAELVVEEAEPEVVAEEGTTEGEATAEGSEESTPEETKEESKE